MPGQSAGQGVSTPGRPTLCAGTVPHSFPPRERPPIPRRRGVWRPFAVRHSLYRGVFFGSVRTDRIHHGPGGCSGQGAHCGRDHPAGRRLHPAGRHPGHHRLSKGPVRQSRSLCPRRGTAPGYFYGKKAFHSRLTGSGRLSFFRAPPGPFTGPAAGTAPHPAGSPTG